MKSSHFSDMIPGAKEIGRKVSETNNMRAQTDLGGLGWGVGGTLSPPSSGHLRGWSPLQKFFGLQRPLDSLKINSSFNNCGYEARQKSEEFYGIKEQNNHEKELVKLMS